MVPSPRRLPHTISPLEGDGCEPPVPGASEPVYIAEGELRGDRRGSQKIWRGTEGSNPSPSSKESGANLTSSEPGASRPGCDSVIVVGTTTSGCVRATVVDAFSLNYRVILAEEGCFDRSEASHAVSLCDMHAKYADVVPMAAILSYFDQLPADLFDLPTGGRSPATPVREAAEQSILGTSPATRHQRGKRIGLTPVRNDMHERFQRPLLSPPTRGVHHLALCTDDMKATIDFYVEVLGMPLVHAMKVPPGLGTGPRNRGNPPYERVHLARARDCCRSASQRA